MAISDAFRFAPGGPEMALKVAGREGLSNYVGDNGSSFGPWQLHLGGIKSAGPGNQGPGLGDQFQHDTGLDLRDPATVPQQAKWVAEHVAKHGWDPKEFHGMKGMGGGSSSGMRNISGSVGDIGSSAAKALVQQSGGNVGRAVDDLMTKLGENRLVNSDDLHEYLRTGGHDLNPRTQAYCAAAVGAALDHAGVPGLASNVASAYLNWGKPVTDHIQKGDVLVMTRSRLTGGQVSPGEVGGHIGLATGTTDRFGRVGMISGNTDGGKVAVDYVRPNTFTARRYDPNGPSVPSSGQPPQAGGGGVTPGGSSLDAQIADAEQKLQEADAADGRQQQGQSGQQQPQGGGKESKHSDGSNPSLEQLANANAARESQTLADMQRRSAEWQQEAAGALDIPRIESAEQLAGIPVGRAFIGPDGKVRYRAPDPPQRQQP